MTLLGTWLLVLPILLPLLVAVVCIALGRQRRAQRQLTLAAAGLYLALALLLLGQTATGTVVAHQVGAWPAPFGITLVADVFSALMLVAAGLVYVTVVMFAVASIDAPRENHGFYPALHLMLMGVSGAFLTGDIFNLFVWFELLLITSFVLQVLGGTRAQLEGAVKYVTLNMVGSVLFVVALGLLYSMTGTLNMADLAQVVPTFPDPWLMTAVACLFLVTFAGKAAAFPLFFWLPASYHTPPVAVTALFSGLLTKVGVYALVRVFTLVFTENGAFLHTVLLVMGGLTMVFGVLGAVAQMDMRRLLSFHIISQIGYLLVGLGLFTVGALAGTVVFLLHVIIAKSALFLVGGVARALRGTEDLHDLGGLYAREPLLAVLFLAPALSLAGVPPFAGFWAKFTLVRAATDAGAYGVVLVALAVSVLTLFSMSKIWAYAFLADGHIDAPWVRPAQYRALLTPVVALAALTLLLGLLAEPLLGLATLAAEQLLSPTAYLAAVNVVLP